MFWLITVPPAPTKSTLLERQKERSKSASKFGLDYGKITLFKMPSLRVGNLDNLLSLSDELVKTDIFIFGIVRRIAEQIHSIALKEPVLTLLSNKKKQLDRKKSSVDLYYERKQSYIPQLLVNRLQIPTYLSQWEWDESLYPFKCTTNEIIRLIYERSCEFDEVLKDKINEYVTNLKKFQELEKKNISDLFTRDLNNDLEDLVCLKKVKHLKKVKGRVWYIETENITTLFVVFPKKRLGEWFDSYESMSPFIVPASSQLITTDRNNNVLVNVSLFKRVCQDFKRNARERGFLVRNHEWRTVESIDFEEERRQLFEKLKTSWKRLVKWSKLNFGECFVDWVHLKVIRTFVESVLRWGMPVEFVTLLIQPKQKLQTKMRIALENAFDDLKPKKKKKKKRKKKKKKDLRPFAYSNYGNDFTYINQEINSNFF
ncbi:v-type proton atpase subunit c [Anaeramoeba flamelloides]|uniref:V-type proton ATPase subunit C n=1 Tax=Anaeramoeba flamelloides TaxID=1746091 RepID=A0AAV7ZBW5_9EUKA|nr:v-type proton atpase subunit c [Anaeramoeba flamelloides]KAJ6233130.1 v-type proton atpase subunit c [Anaeramoeba flamelloides]